MKSPLPKVALIGNPNSGKSTLFNQLTGLRQKTGNFPGVTVEKKTGTLRFPDTTITGTSTDTLTLTEATLIDLPGVYSIYPKSRDEQVAIDILANPQHPDHPDAVVVVADASNLQRNLLLFTQIADLGLPTVLALNMLDVADSMNLKVNAVQLAMQMNVPVVKINARTGEGVDRLREAIKRVSAKAAAGPIYFFDPAEGQADLIEEVKAQYQLDNNYLALQYLCQHGSFTFLDTNQKADLEQRIASHNFDKTDFQAHETITRYAKLRPLVAKSVTIVGESDQPAWTRRLDKVLLHPVWGYVAFLLVLLVIFQAIFAWAQYPSDWLDGLMASGIDWTRNTLPEGVLNDLLTDGLMAGVSGVLVFIPQIAFLFGLVGLLEESGYMARVMVIMDKLMRKFGLNGRSVVPLISGVACAVPAIMTTRSITNTYERLLTIFVTPLMSCSARLPIYTILIALVVPDETVLGFLNLQGLVLLGLYMLGLVGALASAWLFSLFIPRLEPSYFILEMPTYKWPRWSHLGITMYDSVKSFVVEAGKIIVAISIVLWVLASYGPGDSMERAETEALTTMASAEAPATGGCRGVGST